MKRYTAIRIAIRDPLPPPTPRDEVLFKLATQTIQRVISASVFGVPISRERARAEAIRALTEHERALLAEDVTDSTAPKQLETPK